MLDDGLSMVLILTRHVCKCISAALLDPLNAQIQQTRPSIDTTGLFMQHIGSRCLLVRSQCAPAARGPERVRRGPRSGEQWWLVMVSEAADSLT